MSLDGAIAYFRERHLALFRVECVVQRVVSAGVFDETTGRVGNPETQLVYQGTCNVRETSIRGQGSDAEVGEREVRLEEAKLWFPPGTAIREDDVMTITLCEHDATMVGQIYRISDVFKDGWQVMRRATGEKIARGPA